jgi:hypothetical protein
MKLSTLLVFVLFVFAISCSSPKESSVETEGWISLFNQKDLTGWDIKIAGYAVNDNFKNTFQVNDSILSVSYNDYDTFTNEFGHLYYNQPYSYYRVKLQYRFYGEQKKGGPDYARLNSGIMVHSQSAQSLVLHQSFPVSLEMQFLATDSVRQSHTGNLCTPGTEFEQNAKLVDVHCLDSDSKYYDDDLWVNAEVIVFGDSIIHHVIEGDTVLTYEHPTVDRHLTGRFMNWTKEDVADSVQWMQKQGMRIREGYIALQAESHPIQFRKIELLNLKGCMDPKALNYKSYYKKADNSLCQYK